MAEVSKIHQKSLQKNVETAIEGVDMAALVDKLLAELIRSLARALVVNLEAQSSDGTAVMSARGPGAPGPLNFYEEVQRYEIELIQWALRQANGNQSAAARLLQIRTTTLNNMIKRYHINWRLR